VPEAACVCAWVESASLWVRARVSRPALPNSAVELRHSGARQCARNRWHGQRRAHWDADFSGDGGQQ